MNWVLLVAPLAAIAVGIAQRRERRGGIDFDHADEMTLIALANAGADLSKETEVLFYLYFPTESHARSAATVATREQFAAEVREPPEEDDTWACILTRYMIPSADAIRASRVRLEELAASLSGEFDGWEAAVAS